MSVFKFTLLAFLLLCTLPARASTVWLSEDNFLDSPRYQIIKELTSSELDTAPQCDLDPECLHVTAEGKAYVKALRVNGANQLKTLVGTWTAGQCDNDFFVLTRSGKMYSQYPVGNGGNYAWGGEYHFEDDVYVENSISRDENTFAGGKSKILYVPSRNSIVVQGLMEDGTVDENNMFVYSKCDSNKDIPIVLVPKSKLENFCEYYLRTSVGLTREELRLRAEKDYESTMGFKSEWFKSVTCKLLVSGGDVSLVDHSGRFPLFYAALYGYPILAEALLQAGANPNQYYNGYPIYSNITALHLAAEHGHEDIVQLLLSYGADVDASLVDRSTPLHYAVKNDHPKVVNLLLEHGAKPWLEEDPTEQLKALITSLSANDSSKIRALVRAGGDVNVQNIHGHTLLYVASWYGYTEVVKSLVDLGAELDRPALIDFRQERKYKELSLVYYESDPAVVSFKGQTPLLAAVANGNEKAALELINAGADISARVESMSLFAIGIAASAGEASLVKAILMANERFGGKALTPKDLTIAMKRASNGEVVQVLLESGISYEGTGVFFRMVFKQDQLGIQTLLDAGVDVNEGNSLGVTPLMMASKCRCLVSVKYLIDLGADIDAQANDGATALIMATKVGDEPVVKYLIEAGADIHKVTNQGETAIDIAQRSENPNLMALFKR